MEMPEPSLGMFSLLPVEVRIMMWKHISPHLHAGRSLPRKPNFFSPYQELLLTSHKIFVEVAALVPFGYNDNTIDSFVRPEYKHKSWIKARNTNGMQWDLEDVHDAISKGFCDLPWHDLNVRIWIRAPHSRRSAQIICLYKNVRALVEILKEVNGFRSLEVAFVSSKDMSWFDDAGQPQCSIKNMPKLSKWGEYMPREKADYSLIIPLLLQIRNAKRARVYSTEILVGIRENRMMGQAFLKAQRIMRKTTPYGSPTEPDLYNGQQIDEHLNLLFMMVEHILDHLPSPTANMLRLERFSTWYTDKLHGHSPYENDLKKILLSEVREANVVKKMNDRYRFMRAHNPLSLAFRSAFPKTFDAANNPPINARGWNRDAWHSVHTNGIPPLSSKRVERGFRKWCMEDDAPENGGEDKNLYSYFYRLLERVRIR